MIRINGFSEYYSRGAPGTVNCASPVSNMRLKSTLAVLLMAAFSLSTQAASPFVITEYMSLNTKTLQDEDNAYSDWIEIFNTASTNANIGGWYLTDESGWLNKWQFPVTNIPPNGFLVIFASGKNRRVPGAQLHTAFSLGAGGEFLALVMPDGVTKASAFPNSIEHFPDIPFGFIMPGLSITNIAVGANVRALVPSGDIGTSWFGTNFDDAAWTAGATGVGYDAGTNYNSAIGLNIGAAMSNVNASAYLRIPFQATDPAAFRTLALRMRYDDGFVAYLNGTEILRRNAPALLAWNSAATNYHGGGLSGSLLENFEGPGTNYTSSQTSTAPGPAVQPGGAGTTGSYLRLLNDTINANANAITFRQTAPGLYPKITADFDFRITDAAGAPADGFSFMLIPTSTYGTSGPGVVTQTSSFEEPNYPGVFGMGFDLYPHATQNDVSLHWNGTELINFTIPRTTLEMVAGTFHHVRLTLEYEPGGARASVTFRGDINGSPAAPYTPITNFFIAGMNPFDCRAEFAGRTGGSDMSVDLDNLNLQFLPAGGAQGLEEFNISSAIFLLTPGTNLLAIQGLNLTAGDTNFLIAPELVASTFTLSSVSNYLSPETHGAWNNVTAAGTLARVAISPPSGAYTNSVTVTLSSGSSSAQIRYTTNGAVPSLTSPLYTSPLTFSADTTLRTRAFESGKIDGPISGASYLLLDTTMTNFTSNLPLILIDTMGATILTDSKVAAYAVCFDTNSNGARVSVRQPPQHTGRVAIEIAGQSSTQFPKKSYNLELRDEQTDDDVKVKLLGLPKGSDWRLYAPYTDKTLMNDLLSYELHEAMGHYSVRRKFVEVFIRTTAGKLAYSDYVGVYVLLEKIRIDPERVDISKPQSGTTNDPITGGYIWKKDKGSPGDIAFTTVHQTDLIANGSALQYHDPDGSKLTPVQRAWLTNYLNTFEAALYGNDWRHPTLGYRAHIDVDSFVDFHWIVEFPKNIDGIRLSNYLSKDRGGPIREEPIWDWNLAWGNANYAQGGLTNGWYYPLIGESQDMYLRRLRTDPDFAQKITDRWGQLRTNLFALPNLLARIEAKTNLLNEAKDREFTRWPRLNSYVWPNPDGANLVPTNTDNVALTWDVNYALNTSYGALIGELKKWVTGRYLWINAQYLATPTLSLPSGFITPGVTLSMAGPSGTLYYTLDNTDPRGSNGVVTAAARVYSGPITLTNNSGVFARVLSGITWSPPARGVYVVATPSLRISEIMFHPENPPVGSLFAEEDFEFIEIQNTGTGAINLSGAQLAGGIQFAFTHKMLAPGQFTVVVRNLAAFQSRYGTGNNVAGVFSGKLANSGDHIVLTGPVGEPILDFNYGDVWYPITDGYGFSLVARDTSASVDVWSQSLSWRAASVFGGSPGAPDPLLSIAPIVVNEVLANSVTPAVDWIELYNPTPTNVNIGGWFLTDSFSNAKKFRIVNGTEIPANGYIVFTEADFNVDPLNNTNSFALSSDGDQVYLFSGNVASNLTGYVDGFDFSASDEGVTFGRYITIDGDVDYPALLTPTYGATNSGPIVGPIVISEIMYRPPDVQLLDNGIDEFIELRNISGSPVPLFSGALPDKTWHLRNAVDFDFPTNVTLAPGETVLVVSFNPTNTGVLAAFRAKYGVSPGVAVFGPYSGQLDNSGERIELHRPGQLGTNGVPYLMAEKITYSDQAPWNVVADGFGASLQRISLSSYANDSANWHAASPTAGADYAGGATPQITQQPSNIQMLANGNTNLTVVAQGSDLRYQWRFTPSGGAPANLDTVTVPTATNATLLLPNIQATQSGSYVVAVYNGAGGVLSSNALVSASTPVTITTQPVSQNVQPGTNVSLVLAATGSGTIRYQWRLYGTSIDGATNAIYSFTNAQLFQHAGIYDAQVSDSISSTLSFPATIVVMVKPTITSLSPPVTVLQGANATFTVSAIPNHPLLPLTYRWLMIGGAIGSWANSSNAVVTIFNCQSNGLLRLSVANTAGSTNVAAGLNVTVLPDFDHDGMGDAWEFKYGMSTNNAADALLDPDGDGMNNRDEFVAGTNPTNTLSVLRLATVVTNAAWLQFTAESNISYTIQARPDLNGAWQSLSNVNSSNTVRAIQFGEALTNQQRFYRVVTPRLP